MKMLLQIVLLAYASVIASVHGQAYTAGCGIALQDIPNPSSDTCTAFFRCYNNRQYSLRCPLGQAFHFDGARCRPETEVDCPLQLQRFQAPAVPHYLRPPNAAQEREVEIRVVHVAPGIDTNNLQFYSNGRPVPVSRQTTAQRGGHTLIAAQQQQQQPLNPVNFQQTPILVRSPDGQLVQGQAIQSQIFQSKPAQSQVIQAQPNQNHVIQGQPLQGHIIQGQPVQSQLAQGQIVQG